MEISTQVASGILIMTITGRMDSNNSRELTAASHTFPDMPVILDMIHVEYINSSALRGLLEFNRRLQVHKTRLVLVESSNGFVEKILGITGFNKIFRIFPSVPEAVHALSGETGSLPGK
jgi:anti-anti-sigma factor